MPDGYVYFVQSVQGGLVKIGFSQNPATRLSSLQIGSPVTLRVAARFPGTARDEADLHVELDEERAHGEWFRPTQRLREAAIIRCGSAMDLVFPESEIPGPVPRVDRSAARREGALRHARERRELQRKAGSRRRCRGCGNEIAGSVSTHWARCGAR